MRAKTRRKLEQTITNHTGVKNQREKNTDEGAETRTKNLREEKEKNREETKDTSREMRGQERQDGRWMQMAGVKERGSQENRGEAKRNQVQATK